MPIEANYQGMGEERTLDSQTGAPTLERKAEKEEGEEPTFILAVGIFGSWEGSSLRLNPQSNIKALLSSLPLDERTLAGNPKVR